MAEQKNAIIYSQPQDPTTYLESKKMELESGMFGKFFGTGAKCNMYIAAFISIMLIILGVLYTLLIVFKGDAASSLDLWLYIFPLLGTILGYLFGTTQSNN